MLPEIKTILYATDLQNGSRQAFRYAIKLAQTYQAHIVFMNAIEPRQKRVLKQLKNELPSSDVNDMNAEGIHALQHKMRERLSRFIEDEKPDIDPQKIEMIIVEDSQPEQAILYTAKKYGVDLVVMGYHHGRNMSKLFQGVTTNKVIKASDLPVLIVPLA
ncbi:universal stress protein [Thaumasiovibrio sp. DFM-14]|uniref:universal stress protein n=1 Tax=Thaumasiovibrio sp. DFM-14 TaxID=3384792 RepID=UPI00399F3A4C